MKAKKSMLPTPADLTLDEIQHRFGTDDKARAYLEEIRWPDGVVCPHCGNRNKKAIWKIEANPAKKIRAGLYQCAATGCKRQFTVTVGTIFEDSHIPLRKWLVAWYLLCSSKKGISSLQIQRMLGLGSYRTALFMMHRIRYALSQPEFTTYLKGVVEMDETYIGGKISGHGRGGGTPNKTCVVSLVERGGNARSFVLDRVTSENLHRKIDEHVVEGAIVVTDDYFGYRKMPPVYDHRAVKHSAKEYSRREGEFNVNTNTVESKFSLLKRGIIGTFHSVSKKHLPLYLAEFDHRFNERKVTDSERTVSGIRQAEGKRLTLKPLKKGNATGP